MEESVRMDRGDVISRIAIDERYGRVLDEIVARDCDIHVEIMEDTSVSVIVYGRRETAWYVIGAKRARVQLYEVGREKLPRKKRRRR